jgi:MarR family 2-MHQ and catechol resistance regulon transcriptional repressor
LVDGLEREGFVLREKPKGDRRTLVIQLTAKGQKLLDQMNPRHYQRVSSLMSQLNQKERKQLADLMMKVAAGIPAMGLD